MKELVERVKCKVLIELDDGREIDVSLATAGGVNNTTNYITDITIDESTNTQNNNPVGVVSSNTLKILLNSNDRTLIPDNENSPYYGFMNSTAIVKVTLTDDEGDVEFNTFYVSNWTSKTTSQNPYQVTIECTDLMAIINKNSVPGGEIVQDITTDEAFKYIIDCLNLDLDDKHQILYDEDDIDFSEFPSMDYNNIEATNMSTWFNIMCQSTLTNIYLKRDNKLTTDPCLDDSEQESVCTLSDSINITEASVDKGGLVGYTGVKVNYIINTINNISTITTLTNQLLTFGKNSFDNIDLGEKTYKITGVRISTDSKIRVLIDSVSYGKRYANIVLTSNSSTNLNATINIYGQTIKENKLFVQKSFGKTNEILEVTNALLSEEYIDKFAEGLLNLIKLKGDTLKVTGYFNPRLKLGDTVYVDVEKSIFTKGYYKIIGLKWKIANTIKCTATLTKVRNAGGEANG